MSDYSSMFHLSSVCPYSHLQTFHLQGSVRMLDSHSIIKNSSFQPNCFLFPAGLLNYHKNGSVILILKSEKNVFSNCISGQKSCTSFTVNMYLLNDAQSPKWCMPIMQIIYQNKLKMNTGKYTQILVDDVVVHLM